MRDAGSVPSPLATLATVLLASALTGLGPGASAATCGGWTAHLPDVGTEDNALIGVATTSASNAWAVGWDSVYDTLQPLIVRWNGATWKRSASPNVGSANGQLLGVAATSTSNAWAVGFSWTTPLEEQTLIEHWDGTDWTRVPSPNPGGSSNSDELWAVAATSETDAWAVGEYDNGTAGQTLVVHWDGTAWKRVPSPNPGGFSNLDELVGVDAISSTNAWAVGFYSNGGPRQTLIEHWNGTAWSRVASPNPGGVSHLDELSAVAATSANDAWAVGDYDNGTNKQTLVLHWDGTAWKRVPSPNPGGVSNFDTLSGVTSTSSTNAWAVGDYYDGTTVPSLIEHWNGTAWKRVASPNVDTFDNLLFGVASSAWSNVWAVGYYYNGLADQALAAHRC